MAMRSYTNGAAQGHTVPVRAVPLNHRPDALANVLAIGPT